MKKYLIIYIGLLSIFSTKIYAQFNNYSSITGYNYIHSQTTLDKSSSTTGDNYIDEISYFDGLGRPSQTVNYGGSPLGHDIVQPVHYDEFGREDKKYLPYAPNITNGVYKTDWESAQSTFYSSTMGFTGQGSVAYSKTVFDDSPLNRVVKQGAPGSLWQPNTSTTRSSSEHIMSYSYETNSSADAVRYWTVSGIYPSVTFTINPTPYQNNTLYKTVTYDENYKPVTEFKDMDGRVVLKVDAMSGKTYYIYDDFGLLRCVMPPLATQSLGTVTFTYSDVTFKELCYYYEYDNRNRMIKKKLPGSVTTYHDIYETHYEDPLDRIEYTVDPNNNKVYYEYDDFSRVIATYSQDNVPGSWLTKTIYDDYGTYDDNLPFQQTFSTSINYIKSDNVKGKVVATETKVLNPISGGLTSLRTVYYYNKYGQLIQTVSDNHLGGRDIISNFYEYTNSDQVYAVYHHHWKNNYLAGSADHIFYTWYHYDHADRLTSVYEKIDNSTVYSITKLTYDETGALKSKQIGQTESGQQTIDYKYNIRGWLTDINDIDEIGSTNDLFKMRLDYRYSGQDIADQSFNGNIMKMEWSDFMGWVHEMDLKYDNLNRITRSTRIEYDNGDWIYNSDNTYETNYTYDANGNITTLKRYSADDDGSYYPILIDDLTYKYYNSEKSNRLKAVGDNATDVWGRGDFNEAMSNGSNSTEYYYDYNGNMTWGQNTYLDNYYNYLNLPYLIDNGDGNPIFKISYSATGVKLNQYTYVGGVSNTDYIGPFVYKDGVLDYIITSEGRAVCSSGNFSYHEWNLKDHLGNIRTTFKSGGSYVIRLQTNDYYPFGLQVSSTGTSTNKYKYNGKEELKSTSQSYGVDMNWLDYGARMYDPSLGRWHVVDPLAQFASPYNYVGNNPIKLIDPNGMWAPGADAWNSLNSQLDEQERQEKEKEKTTKFWNEVNNTAKELLALDNDDNRQKFIDDNNMHDERFISTGIHEKFKKADLSAKDADLQVQYSLSYAFICEKYNMTSSDLFDFSNVNVKLNSLGRNEFNGNLNGVSAFIRFADDKSDLKYGGMTFFSRSNNKEVGFSVNILIDSNFPSTDYRGYKLSYISKLHVYSSSRTMATFDFKDLQTMKKWYNNITNPPPPEYWNK